MFKRVIPFIVGCLIVTSCGGSDSPTSPASSTPTLNLTGTWSGNASDSTGPGQMTWRLSQSGSSAVTGSITASTLSGRIVFNGTISGTLAGTTFGFTFSVPRGGISGFPNCTVTASGSASGITNTSMSGMYSGENSCAGAFSNGRFTLTKQ